MSDKILFIYEGERSEKEILENIKYNFFSSGYDYVFYPYKTVIYDLWMKFKDDEDLDLILHLKSTDPTFPQEIQKRTDVTEVFLFFDYDGQDHRASDEELSDILQLFNDEFELGKLYISYPMVEAIKHIRSDFSCHENCTYFAKRNDGYKTLVSKYNSPEFQCLRNFTGDQWDNICIHNFKKLNCIMSPAGSGDYTFPDKEFVLDTGQFVIFQNQLNHHINPNGEVVILSGFPFFLAEYFGKDFLDTIY